MCRFPFENPKTHKKNFKKLVLEMQNVMQIATNAGHTVQNEGRTTQNDDRFTLNVCQGPKGGLRSPPGPRGPP